MVQGKEMKHRPVSFLVQNHYMSHINGFQIRKMAVILRPQMRDIFFLATTSTIYAERALEGILSDMIVIKRGSSS